MEGLRMFVVCLISLCLVGLTGCKQLQPVVDQTTTTSRSVEVSEIQRDSVVTIAPDSASIRALFECDSLNQVVMRELEVVKGRKVKPEVKYIQGGVLEIKMPVDSEAIYLSWKEKYELVTDSIKISTISTIKEKPPWYARSLTGFAFAIVSVIVLLVTIVTIVRRK